MIDTPTAPMEAQMPTMVMTALPTNPMPRVDATCGWCDIRLTAVPELPRPYFRPGSAVIEYFHPGCITAQRTKDAGIPAL